MTISILTDNAESWFIPYGNKLKNLLESHGFEVYYVQDKNLIKSGEICFLLSCSRLVDKDFLSRNKHNIVVHASDLPKGRGFSPLQWQILEGKHEIVLTLFEVAEEVDAGPFYIKDTIVFEGFELLGELRNIMGEKIIKMCLSFAQEPTKYLPEQQMGSPSYYPKRKKKDDILDIHKSIYEQFNHLRIADNENYPLRFEINGHKFILKIFKDE